MDIKKININICLNLATFFLLLAEALLIIKEKESKPWIYYCALVVLLLLIFLLKNKMERLRFFVWKNAALFILVGAILYIFKYQDPTQLPFSSIILLGKNVIISAFGMLDRTRFWFGLAVYFGLYFFKKQRDNIVVSIIRYIALGFIMYELGSLCLGELDNYYASQGVIFIRIASLFVMCGLSYEIFLVIQGDYLLDEKFENTKFKCVIYFLVFLFFSIVLFGNGLIRLLSFLFFRESNIEILLLLTILAIFILVDAQLPPADNENSNDYSFLIGGMIIAFCIVMLFWQYYESMYYWYNLVLFPISFLIMVFYKKRLNTNDESNFLILGYWSVTVVAILVLSMAFNRSYRFASLCAVYFNLCVATNRLKKDTKFIVKMLLDIIFGSFVVAFTKYKFDIGEMIDFENLFSSKFILVSIVIIFGLILTFSMKYVFNKKAEGIENVGLDKATYEKVKKIISYIPYLLFVMAGFNLLLN